MGQCKIYILLIIAILFSCQQVSQTTDKNNNAHLDIGLKEILPDTLNKMNGGNENLKPTEISTDSCHELLLLLVKSSSFDSKLKELKFDVRVEVIHNGIAKLELVINNEERNEDVALSWLEMDFNKKELRDITVDPDMPIKLKYDSTLFSKIDEHCRMK